jgi:hypothetical protein
VVRGGRHNTPGAILADRSNAQDHIIGKVRSIEHNDGFIDVKCKNLFSRQRGSLQFLLNTNTDTSVH